MVLSRKRPGVSLELPLQKIKVSRCCSFARVPDPKTQELNDYFNLEKLCVLGHGNYGVVHKVIHKKTSAVYAMKIIHDDSSSKSQETQILTSTDSPYLTKCFGVFEAEVGKKAILMEFMEEGTLDNFAKKNGPLSETLLADIAIQVLNGLKYLHESKIVHLDVKPGNLLVNKEMKVKIGDFGISKTVGKNGFDSLDCSQGTYAYMSPERLDSEKFGSGFEYAGDVWSLGVTLWELFVGYFPLLGAEKKGGASLMEIVLTVCCGELPSFPNQASDELVDFLKCCLEIDPSKRWTASQLLSHPFVYR